MYCGSVPRRRLLEKVLGIDYVQGKLVEQIWVHAMTYAMPDSTVMPVATFCIAEAGITDVFVPGFTPFNSRVCSQIACVHRLRKQCSNAHR